MIPEAFVCPEVQCIYLEIATLRECERSRCPFTYQRGREEAAIDQARKDEKAKESKDEA